MPSLTKGQRKLQSVFTQNGWKAFAFQRQTWAAIQQGQSGLVHAPTGTGKTYAIWGGILGQWINRSIKGDIPKASSLKVLWITPLRALAFDTCQSLTKLARQTDVPWDIQVRTSDLRSSAKAKQFRSLPNALITTPESLSVLLSYPESHQKLKSVTHVVVDEWHELLSTKRGTQTELCLARLKRWNKGLQIWGLSATLGNLKQALECLMGAPTNATFINGDLKKRYKIETLLPKKIDSFPWSGHLGLNLLEPVVEAIEAAKTTLVFTNVRSQTESWFRALVHLKPEWASELGIHHGSIDRVSRQAIEARLREGSIKAVVCTASLDLGVDFTPVEQVIQIGGPKGIARLLQRAGRSGHRPGAVSRVLCVPTQAFELIEYSAAREAIEQRFVESREPLPKPLDLLAQHLVTVALGGGFEPETMFEEVKTAYAYRDLTREEWDWTLDFVVKGGKALKAYDQYRKVVAQGTRMIVDSKTIARFHRMSIGTITSDQAIDVRFASGRSLGTVEESFIARVPPRSLFAFAGHTLRLEKVRGMTAIVKKAKGKSGAIPVWGGGRSPLSSELADRVRSRIQEARNNLFKDKEMKAIRRILKKQVSLSQLPSSHEFLIEQVAAKQGTGWFLFPFAGRLAHEGLSALLGYRLTQISPMTLSVAFNDYGLQLQSNSDLTLTEEAWKHLLSPQKLLEDLSACLNETELARRQFREVARVAGLIFQGFPGTQKPARHLQASSTLLFEVFDQYDPENLLLRQAKREVLERQLDVKRLVSNLTRIQNQKLLFIQPKSLTPFSFPLWAEGLRSQVSSEKWTDQVQAMAQALEDVA